MDEQRLAANIARVRSIITEAAQQAAEDRKRSRS